MVLGIIIVIGFLGYFTLMQLGTHFNAREAALAKAITETEKKKIKVKYLKKESFLIAFSFFTVFIFLMLTLSEDIAERLFDWVSSFVSGYNGQMIVSVVLIALMIIIPSLIVSIIAGKIGENQ